MEINMNCADHQAKGGELVDGLAPMITSQGVKLGTLCLEKIDNILIFMIFFTNQQLILQFPIPEKEKSV